MMSVHGALNETGSGLFQSENLVRHGRRKPRKTEQKRTKSASQSDGDHWQQWQIYRCHIGLMRCALAYAKETPQYDSQHS